MSFPGKTKPERMSCELSYWEDGGAKEQDFHLATYTRVEGLESVMKSLQAAPSGASYHKRSVENMAAMMNRLFEGSF